MDLLKHGPARLGIVTTPDHVPLDLAPTPVPGDAQEILDARDDGPVNLIRPREGELLVKDRQEGGRARG